MRSFICSALLITGLLVGQQWMAKTASANEPHRGIEQRVVAGTGFATWAKLTAR